MQSVSKSIIAVAVLAALTSTHANAVIVTSDSVILPNTTTTVTQQFQSVENAITGNSQKADDAFTKADDAKQRADAAFTKADDAMREAGNAAASITGLERSIDTVKDAVVDEYKNRVAADTALQGQIDVVNKSIKTSADGLAQEIKDRTAGDDALHTELTNQKAAQQQIDQAQSQIIGTHDNLISDNKAAIDTNTQAIGNKVDTKTFTDDQKRQDDAVTSLTTTVNSKASQTDVNTNKKAIAADEANITANKSAIDTEVKAEQQHFSTLSSGVQQAQTTGAAAQNRADVAFANAEANHQALANTNQRLANDEKTLANHEQRISDLEANNQTNFNSLKDQQNKDRKEFRAGLAGAFALTAIPQAPQGHTVGFGMGVGTFNGQNAVSAGISARVSANVSVKTGLSWDTADNVGAGAGVLFSY